MVNDKNNITELKLVNQLIGYQQGDRPNDVFYSSTLTPESPLSDSYLTNFSLYEQNGKLSDEPTADSKKLNFINVEQAVSYGKAKNAGQDDLASKILNTSADGYKEDPSVFVEETKDLPKTANDQLIEKTAVRAKFNQDPVAKSVMKAVKGFNLVDANDKNNSKGKLTMQVLDDLQNSEQTQTNSIYKPQFKKIQYYNTVIGKAKGNQLFYGEQATPQSPLNNSYVSKNGFNLYFAGGKMSPRYTQGAKAYHFSSVDQVTAFGLAVRAHDKFALTEIYNTEPDYARTHPDAFKEALTDTPEPANWSTEQKVWQKAGMEAKFAQDEFAKKTLDIARKYTITTEDNEINSEGKMLNEVADNLTKQGVFKPLPTKDNSLQTGDHSLQDMADGDPEQKQDDDNSLSL